jgi:hypothetical protein
MALMNCPECGKQVSDRAAACPHCGNPLRAAPTTARGATTSDRAKRKPRWWQPTKGAGCGCLGFIAFIGIMVWVAKPSPPSPARSADLSADVQFTGTQFVITNHGGFFWSNCKLEINSGIVRGGYSSSAPMITAGHAYTIGAMQFAKSSGERFNPLTMKPNNFYVECDTPQGRASYMGEWK